MSDNEQTKIFQKNLLRYLRERHKSQSEVAAAIGVNHQTFSTWCCGIAYPRMGKMQALADYFNINKSDLIEDKTNQSDMEEVADLCNQISRLPLEKREMLKNYIRFLLSDS